MFINEYCTALEQHAHGSLSTIPDVNSSRAQSVTVTLQGKGVADSAVRLSAMHSALKELETRREKGVDLCILMDGTDSMVSSSYMYNTSVVPPLMVK